MFVCLCIYVSICLSVALLCLEGFVFYNMEIISLEKFSQWVSQWLSD